MFKGSRLLCGRYPRSGALKSQQLRSVESALQWTTGKQNKRALVCVLWVELFVVYR